MHQHCRCAILPIEAIVPGAATKEGEDGADWWIYYHNQLPAYYISRNDASQLKWRHGKSLSKYAPGKMLFGGIYHNENGHLPMVPGRIWYEADINYYEGRRNGYQLLYSNDGLLFVTYDHYLTFYEINVEEYNEEN